MGERCIMYIDGYNFYYAIKRHPDITPLHLGWCDFASLARQSLLPAGATLERIKYFTAPVGRYGLAGGPAGSESARQDIWLAALRSVADLEIIEGVHTGDPGSPRSRKEKETDVNIAITAVIDAARDRFDRAIFLTGDRDQRPTVQALVTEFSRTVDLWLAPSQQKGFWAAMEGLSGVRVRLLSPRMLQRARLPEQVTLGGRMIDVPRAWQAPK